MGGVGIEEQPVAGLQVIGLASVPIQHLAGEDIEELHTRVLEKAKDFRFVGEGDEVRLDRQMAAYAVAEQAVFASGTFSAAATAVRVLSAGELTPRSILDNMPSDRPARLATSAMVTSSCLRNSRICATLAAAT